MGYCRPRGPYTYMATVSKFQKHTPAVASPAAPVTRKASMSKFTKNTITADAPVDPTPTADTPVPTADTPVPTADTPVPTADAVESADEANARRVAESADAPTDDGTPLAPVPTADAVTPTADAPVPTAAERAESATTAFRGAVSAIVGGSDPAPAADLAGLFGACHKSDVVLTGAVSAAVMALFTATGSDPMTAGQHAAAITSYGDAIRATLPVGKSAKVVDPAAARQSAIAAYAARLAALSAIRAACDAVDLGDAPDGFTADAVPYVIDEKTRDAINAFVGRVTKASKVPSGDRAPRGTGDAAGETNPLALAVGDVLSHTFRDGVTRTLTIEKVETAAGFDGSYAVNGIAEKRFASLTAAARAVNGGKSVNGRDFWRAA